MPNIDKLVLEIVTPPDKSITHRAIMLSAVAEGDSVIENYLSAQDCMSTLKAFEDMGVKVERTKNRLKVRGVGFNGLKKPANSIDAGNSGTTTRLLSGLLAAQNFETTIIGDESLSKRPMKRVIEPLNLMGVDIKPTYGNFLPMVIRGNPDLKPITYVSKISSAQVKSCVLFAGMQARGKTTYVEPVRSRDHSERMLKAVGVKIEVSGNSVSVTGPSKIQPQNIQVPGDISSAAFFLVLGAIHPNAEVLVKNVGINPTRDGIVEVLQKMGANISFIKRYEVSGEPVADILVKSSKLKAVEIDSTIMPRLVDEIPVIALMATQATGKTVISGAHELRVKESDRLKAIASELKKMGADVEEISDGLIINGPVQLKRSDFFNDYQDHRIAMMIAVAQKTMGIEPSIFSSVSISFPNFFELLKGMHG